MLKRQTNLFTRQIGYHKKGKSLPNADKFNHNEIDIEHKNHINSKFISTIDKFIKDLSDNDDKKNSAKKTSKTTSSNNKIKFYSNIISNNIYLENMSLKEEIINIKNEILSLETNKIYESPYKCLPSSLIEKNKELKQQNIKLKNYLSDLKNSQNKVLLNTLNKKDTIAELFSQSIDIMNNLIDILYLNNRPNVYNTDRVINTTSNYIKEKPMNNTVSQFYNKNSIYLRKYSSNKNKNNNNYTFEYDKLKNNKNNEIRASFMKDNKSNKMKKFCQKINTQRNVNYVAARSVIINNILKNNLKIKKNK